MDEQKALKVMRELVESNQLTDPDSARGKLLQVAAHLFRNKGFERTTVRDLAGAVGIQSGSIFHHFKSKDEILRAVMEETIRYNTALMRAAIADAGGVRERVLALIRCELQSIMGGSGEAMAVLVYEWRSLSEDGQAKVLALRDIYEELWLQVLGEAKDAGFIRGDVFITRRFMTGALSWTTTWFRPGGSLSLGAPLPAGSPLNWPLRSRSACTMLANFCGAAASPLKGAITTGNWVMPTPVTSTRNWAQAGMARRLKSSSWIKLDSRPIRKKTSFMSVG